MKPDEWTRVRPLLARLLELPADEHTAFLAEACPDEGLRARVLELYAADTPEDGFLDPPPPAAAGRVGERLGPWRLVSPLGEGGMGEVWRAERADGAFEKTVAVKLLHARFGTPTLTARFHRERSVLARLVHPDIARLLDGGTTPEGVPYLVMEHVDGRPIDRFCSEEGLGLPARLELFLQVCEAVAAAHGNLVVHRDLKPANILVTRDGSPVLLDFGIAKVLDAEGEPVGDVTGAAPFPLTPGYASPEQLRGETITTAADVYSLGVILYGLLTDQRPYEPEGLGLLELVQLVSEREPPAPSTVAPADRRRRLRGDLDTIVAKAMSRDPGRRYRSASDLAEDVRRHLTGLPVLARPDSVAYRVGRFVKRHTVLVGAAVVLFVVMAVSLAVITQLLLETRSARSEAQRGWQAADVRADEMRALASSLVFDIHDSVEHLAGATPARAALLGSAVATLETLSAEAGDDADLLAELAGASTRLGDLQGRPTAASYGDFEAALASQRRSLELLERALVLAPERADLRRERLGVRTKIGSLQLRLGQTAQALDLFEQAHAEASRPTATGLFHVAEAQLDMGRTGDALATLDEALSLARQRVGDQAEDREARRTLHVVQNKRGHILRQQHRHAAAEEALAEAVQVSTELLAARPEDGQLLRDLALALGELGSLLDVTGRASAAREVQQRQLALFEQLVARDAANVMALKDLSLAHEKLGRSQAAAGEWEDALASYRRALELDEQVVAAGAGGRVGQRDVGHCHLMLGDALAALGRSDDALDAARQATAILAPLVASDPEDAVAARDLAMSHLRAGLSLLESGEAAAALPAFEAHHELIMGLAAADEDHAWTQRMAMVAGYFVGMAKLELGRDPERERADRVQCLNDAIAALAESLRRVDQLGARGMLDPGDGERVPWIESQIASCRAELATLQADP